VAAEARRGCGYRKTGGLYLVGSGLSAPCDRMPYPLDRCRTCGAGVKFTRGHTWLQPDFFSRHVPESHPLGLDRTPECTDEAACPVCNNRPDFAPHMLLWIGRSHYSPESYLAESLTLGVSRRIPAMPKGLVLGETWVLLAHLDAIPARLGSGDGYNKPLCSTCGRVFGDHWTGSNGIGLRDSDYCCPTDRNGNGGDTTYVAAKPTPGIFCAFVPRAVELLLAESDATPERVAKELSRGVHVVTVPDGDKDHQGSVWDKDGDKDEEQPELPGVEVRS
jgi:hypothetical protein